MPYPSPRQRNRGSGRSPNQYVNQPRLYSDKRINFINNMRLVWEQHAYWTRMAVVSVAEKRADEADTFKRLLRNPKDLAKVFSEHYSRDVTNIIEKLVTEHLQIAAELVKAIRDDKKAEADVLNLKWHENADQIADAFASFNPYYDREEVRKMFYTHLDLTAQQAARRLEADYPADIAVFDKSEQQIMEMADMFAYGVLRQFPQDFR